MELDRILQKHGFGTRKDCRRLVRHGHVKVNGSPCEDPFCDVPTSNLVFSVDGVDWPYREFATILLYKPAGYECSRKPVHHPGVLSLLPPALRERGVQPIGRLDEDTTGLLIITDDGQLNHQLSSPKKRVPKVYLVHTADALDERQISALLAGVVLADDPEPVCATECEILDSHRLRLTITSGKYHQVKRMIGAVGNRVLSLHREAMGRLDLAGLQPGEWRWMEAPDFAAVTGSAG